MLNLCKIACRIKKKCCNVVCELINLPQYFNLTKNYLSVLYSTLVTYYTLFLGHPNRIGCLGRQTNRMLLVSVTYILKYAGTCSNAACPRAIDIADYPRFNLLLHPTFPLVILFLLSEVLPTTLPQLSLPDKNQNAVVMDLVQAAPLAASHLFLSPPSLPSHSLLLPLLHYLLLLLRAMKLIYFCFASNAEHKIPKKKKPKKKTENFSFLRLLV